MTPRVSILIRSMDRPTLPRAMASAAAQECPDLEIVVVSACGGRHRPLPARFAGRDVVFLPSHRPLSRSAAANAALDAARGEWLNFLDDDDELLPGHVETLSAALRDDGRKARLAFGLQEVVDLQLVRIAVFGLAGPPGEPFTRLSLFDDACFGIHAALFHRSVLERGARFDTAFGLCEDHDFWLQCAALTPFLAVPRVTSRWHGCIGDSGGGWGANWHDERMAAARAQVAAKWSAVRAAYAASPRGRLEEAKRSLARESAESALAICEAVLAQWPDDPNALNFTALANHRCGRAERARELIRRALRALPGNAGLARNAALLDAAPAHEPR